IDSVRRVALVAWHVFKEGIRDRVLYAIGGVAVLLVLASIVVAEITAGQDVKIIKDFGLAVIEMAVLLMAIVVGVGLVAGEIERRSIVSLLSKPLARWELIVGKYGGLLLTVAVNLIGMTAALYLLLSVMATRLTPASRAALDAPLLDPRLLLVTVMTGAEAALLVAVALFFSTFSSSALLSIAFSAGIYVIGLLSADLRAFGAQVDVSLVIAAVVQAIGWV